MWPSSLSRMEEVLTGEGVEQKSSTIESYILMKSREEERSGTIKTRPNGSVRERERIRRSVRPPVNCFYLCERVCMWVCMRVWHCVCGCVGTCARALSVSLAHARASADNTQHTVRCVERRRQVAPWKEWSSCPLGKRWPPTSEFVTNRPSWKWIGTEVEPAPRQR